MQFDKLFIGEILWENMWIRWSLIVKWKTAYKNHKNRNDDENLRLLALNYAMAKDSRAFSCLHQYSLKIQNQFETLSCRKKFHFHLIDFHSLFGCFLRKFKFHTRHLGQVYFPFYWQHQYWFNNNQKHFVLWCRCWIFHWQRNRCVKPLSKYGKHVIPNQKNSNFLAINAWSSHDEESLNHLKLMTFCPLQMHAILLFQLLSAQASLKWFWEKNWNINTKKSCQTDVMPLRRWCTMNKLRNWILSDSRKLPWTICCDNSFKWSITKRVVNTKLKEPAHCASPVADILKWLSVKQ